MLLFSLYKRFNFAAIFSSPPLWNKASGTKKATRAVARDAQALGSVYSFIWGMPLGNGGSCP
ncbi:MAG TPA: hypothetical protein EYQ43_06355 [Methyloprofundus sp.]|nr:hypothetical protein [Methyloprofundus sp.]